MTDFFYRVEEFLTTFGQEPYHLHAEEFRGDDLLDCRRRAMQYYHERNTGIQERGHFFNRSFAAPSEFKTGENSAYSITLALIEHSKGEAFGQFYDDEIAYYIEGESEAERNESLSHEKAVFEQLGISLNETGSTAEL